MSNRISLKDNLQFKMYFEAMKVLRDNLLSLTDYDRRLFQDLEDAHDMFGRSMTVTVKQMNHIKQVAWDFERGA